MRPDRLACVSGAGGMKPAAARRRSNRKSGGDGVLVNPDQRLGGCCGHAGDDVEKPAALHGSMARGAKSRHARTNRCSSAAVSTRRTCERAVRMRSRPAGTRCWLRRNISRRRRLARFLRTALPIAARDATTPARAGAQSPRERQMIWNAPQSTRRPPERVAWKSRFRLSRWRAVRRWLRRGAGFGPTAGVSAPVTDERSRFRRPSGACGPCGDGRRGPCGRRGLTCARGTRSCGRVSCGAGGMWASWFYREKRPSVSGAAGGCQARALFSRRRGPCEQREGK